MLSFEISTAFSVRSSKMWSVPPDTQTTFVLQLLARGAATFVLLAYILLIFFCESRALESAKTKQSLARLIAI